MSTEVEAPLAGLEIPVKRAPRLVRGLDYYLRTVFEVISPELGEDTVICGGGRYDRLISDLGGKAVPGVGFAIGEDRLIEVLPQSFKDEVFDQRVVTVLPLGDGAAAPAHGSGARPGHSRCDGPHRGHRQIAQGRSQMVREDERRRCRDHR